MQSALIWFPRGDIDHEKEWDPPLWVESYTTFEADSLPQTTEKLLTTKPPRDSLQLNH